MTRNEMIKGLRYKAENIKARIEPEFFAEVADYLEAQKWISIEEGHPEKYENVLVKDIDGDVTCARIWEDPCDSMVFCEFFSGEPIDDVIEWRRIPK